MFFRSHLPITLIALAVDIPPGVYTVTATFWYEGQTSAARHDVTWVDAGV